MQSGFSQRINDAGSLDEASAAIYNYGSSGYGFDAGLLVRLPDLNALFGLQVGSFAFGINWQDISKTTLTWNTPFATYKESIPTNVNLGLAYSNRRVSIGNSSSLISGRDAMVGKRTSAWNITSVRRWHSEWGYRAGGGSRAALGVQLRQFRLDYALLIGDIINTHFSESVVGVFDLSQNEPRRRGLKPRLLHRSHRKREGLSPVSLSPISAA